MKFLKINVPSINTSFKTRMHESIYSYSKEVKYTNYHSSPQVSTHGKCSFQHDSIRRKIANSATAAMAYYKENFKILLLKTFKKKLHIYSRI